MNRKILRVIDANFNRSREGLRVCEDIARFVMDSPGLARRLRSTRHRISRLVDGYAGTGRIILTDFRDSVNDVGRASRMSGGITRYTTKDVYIANLERSKESVRVLEEFFKIADEGIAAALSRVRFELYDIERSSMDNVPALR